MIILVYFPTETNNLQLETIQGQTCQKVFVKNSKKDIFIKKFLQHARAYKYKGKSDTYMSTKATVSFNSGSEEGLEGKIKMFCPHF